MKNESAERVPRVVLLTTEFDYTRRITEDAAELYGSNDVLLDYGILAGTFNCSAHVDYTLERSDEWFKAISRVVDKYLTQPLTQDISNRVKAGLNGKDGNSFQELNQHLTTVFMNAMQNHSSDAFDKFEDISLMIKKTNFKFSNPKPAFEVNHPKENTSTNQYKN